MADMTDATELYDERTAIIMTFRELLSKFSLEVVPDRHAKDLASKGLILGHTPSPHSTPKGKVTQPTLKRPPTIKP